MHKSKRFKSGLLFFILSLNFLLRFLVAIRPLKFIDGLTIPDDAYISFTFAKNIAKGLGPLYGLDYSNGFQPLYVFLIAPLWKIFPNDLITPVHLALALLAIFDTLSLWLIIKIINQHCESQRTKYIVALAWIVNPYIIATTCNGLETSISTFFIVLTIYYFQKWQSKLLESHNSKLPFKIGIIIGIAALARIDNFLLAPAIVISLMITTVSNKTPIVQSIRAIVLLSTGALLAYSPWLLYSFYYTGDILPLSGKAIRLMSLTVFANDPEFANWPIIILKRGLKAILVNNWVYLSLIFAFGLFLMVSKQRQTISNLLKKFRAYNTILIFGILLFCAYNFFVFGEWYFERYLYPITLVIILYFSLLVDSFISISRRPIINKSIFISLIVFIICAFGVQPSFRSLYFSKDSTSLGYMNIGIWAKDNIADGSIVGSSQTGALGYFAENLKVINLDGVVNKKCYESLEQMRNIDYIKEAKIEYIIGWENSNKYIQWRSEKYERDMIVKLKKIEGFMSWRHQWFLYGVR